MVDEETTRNIGYMDGNTEEDERADSIEDAMLDVIDRLTDSATKAAMYDTDLPLLLGIAL